MGPRDSFRKISDNTLLKKWTTISTPLVSDCGAKPSGEAHRVSAVVMLVLDDDEPDVVQTAEIADYIKDTYTHAAVNTTASDPAWTTMLSQLEGMLLGAGGTSQRSAPCRSTREVISRHCRNRILMVDTGDQLLHRSTDSKVFPAGFADL